MRFRWTIDELNAASDMLILRSLVVERKSNLTNVYSPLAKRLDKLYAKLDGQILHEQSTTPTSAMNEVWRIIENARQRLNPDLYDADKLLEKAQHIVLNYKPPDPPEPSVCKRAGEKLDNQECIALGECSWFRHSQDSFRLYPELSNVPPGYRDE
jgi:hypothetical protein